MRMLIYPPYVFVVRLLEFGTRMSESEATSNPENAVCQRGGASSERWWRGERAGGEEGGGKFVFRSVPRMLCFFLYLASVIL